MEQAAPLTVKHPNEYIIDHSGLPSSRPFDNYTGCYSLLAVFPVALLPRC